MIIEIINYGNDTIKLNGSFFNDNIIGRVEFKNASFKYNQLPILNRITFTALPNQVMTIVGKTGKIIDFVEDRRLNSLLKYFSYYTHEARNKVKLIVIDMYSPYISLIKKMFPNADIIIDKFHIVQLISTSLNKTQINLMKRIKRIIINLKDIGD